MKKLTEDKKRFFDFTPANTRTGSALLKTDKKTSKKTKSAAKKIILELNQKRQEGNMTNKIQTAIMVLTFLGGGIALVFATGGRLERIDSGIKQNSKSLTEIIKLNKSVEKRFSVLEKRVDKNEWNTGLILNSSEIKIQKKK